MEHHFLSSNIITNVEHDVHGRLMLDDFFIVNVNHWEAAQLLGSVHVDEKSMMLLLKWAEDPAGGFFTLLISIDGRYGAIAQKSDLDKPKTGSEIVHTGEVWTPIRRVKAEVRRVLELEPELAKRLNLRAFQKAVPDRMTNLGLRSDFSPETIGAEVGDALRNIESATDDALVWIAMVGATSECRLDDKAIEDSASELQMRLQKRSEFRSTFFPLDKVTLQEINARSRRAKRDLQTCQRKFPAGQFFTDEETYRFARGLSNDRLADLCVLLHYQENWGHEPFKVLLIEFGQRVWKALGRD